MTLRWRQRVRWMGRLAGGATLALVAAWFGLPLVPLPDALMSPPPSSVEWQDCDGRPLRTDLNASGSVCRDFSEAGVPEVVVRATLAAEDARFWSHPGVDWRSTARAAWQCFRRRRVVSGGSTVTQQLIKLARPRPRTLYSKGVEALQALALERTWDKERILAEYLRRLDYGNHCEGIEAAARHYFHKNPSDLSLAEAAYLAGLPQAPSRLNPRRRPERAKARQEWVLDRCRALGWVDGDRCARARLEPVVLAAPGNAFVAPHFVERARALMGFGRPASPIRTTVDLDIQRWCEERLRARLGGLAGHHAGNGAVVVIDNRRSALRAMVGSVDWKDPRDGQVNAALAARSPGSALKPFTYLLAFEAGATAADIVADVPSEFWTATGVFRPVNYDRSFSGPVRLREALANSLNVPAVRLLDQYGGAKTLLSKLGQCGIGTLRRPAVDYGLGLTLGGGEVRLLELANAYAAIARLGEWRPVEFFPERDGASDRVGSGERPRRVFSADSCWLVADILSDADARTRAFGMDGPLSFPFPVACKTGTSTGFRDNWAIGFTPEFTVGVWVGNSDGSPMENLSGVEGAAPVLHDVFEWLHERRGTGWFSPPDGVARMAVHPATGHRLVGCALVSGVVESFLPGRLPKDESGADYDEIGRVRLSGDYWDWLAGGGGGGRFAPGGSAAGEAAFRIVSPAPGTVLYLDADLPGSAQKCPLRATGPCVWTADDLPLFGDSAGVSVGLTPGVHKLAAREAGSGRRAETWIEIRRL